MPPLEAEQAFAQTSSRSRTLPPGPWTPPAAAPEDGLVGFIVMDGLVSRDLVLGAGVARDLLGPGDLATLEAEEAELVPVNVLWTVCAPTKVAYVNATMLGTLAKRPDLNAQLLTRAARQAGRQAVHRAICQLPRTNERIVAFLWMLAERWGRVGAQGIVVPVDLTHQALGQMIGARRPTVSLALKELAAEGIVQRRGDGAWLLAPESNLDIAGNVRDVPAPAAGLVLVPTPDEPLAPQRPEVEPEGRAVLEERVANVLAAQARAHDRMVSAVESSVEARSAAQVTRGQVLADREQRRIRP